MTQRQQPPNARFWIWYPPGDQWVKLTLRPGQQLSYGYGGRHEEGWSWTGETYSHEGDHVLCQFTSDGSDCDGRLTRRNDSRCDLDKLKARDMKADFPDWLDCRGIFAPEWERVASHQRDYQAEAAGY